MKPFRKFILMWALLSVSSVALSVPYEVGGKDKKNRVKARKFNNGAGISLGAGNYNGFSFIRRLHDEHYVQAMLGFRLFLGQFVATSDYIMAFPRMFTIIRDLSPYYGVGITGVFFDEFQSLTGSMKDNGSYMGIRAPVGAKMDIELFDLNMDVFGEVTPGLLVAPAGTFFLGLSIGMRYLF